MGSIPNAPVTKLTSSKLDARSSTRYGENMRKLTDSEIIANHHPRMRQTARIELKIVNALIARAEAQGVKLEVWPTGFGMEYSEEPYDVKTALFDLDDAQVFVIDANDESLGWIRLVFGNGEALISDYTVRLEDFLSPLLK